MDGTKQVVWITGASSGIGQALAKRYCASGYLVILSARRLEELEKTKQSLQQPDHARVLQLDLAESDLMAAKVQEALSFFGHIDVLINNGGISQRSKARDTSQEVDRRVMEVNYFGNVALSKALLPHFLERKSGHFVVITSMSAKFGFFLRSAYSASKHALHGFYESLRLEEQKNGIQITLVCPTLIKTDISKHALDKEGQASGINDPLQENGISPEECADQIYKAQQSGKLEVVIGKKKIAILLKRLFPRIFHTLLSKQEPELP